MILNIINLQLQKADLRIEKSNLKNFYSYNFGELLIILIFI